MVTNKTPGAASDILAASANNLYVGVTMDDLDGLRGALRAELAAGKRATASSSRRSIGSAAATPTQIARIVAHLEAAIPFATEPMAAGAARPDRVLSTGRDRGSRGATTSPGSATRTRRSTPSTASSRSTWTPRGIKGAWEALVYYVNHEKTAQHPGIAENAQWFEDHMPWDPSVPQAEVTGRHRQRHRRRDRDRRFRADDADRRSTCRTIRRSASATAASRCRSRTSTEAYEQVDAGRVPQRVRVDAGGGGARRRRGARSPAS